jgi:tetratricopeptide (TPR) repeat protein
MTSGLHRLCLFIVLVATFGSLATGRAQAPLAVAASAGSGNPFPAPAEKIYSIYDYRGIDNVSDSLKEFIELNDDLPGSVTPALLTTDAARRNLRALLDGDKNRAFLKAVADAPSLQTVEALDAAAMVFFVKSRSAEALACLVHAAEKAPQNPSTLLNLASAALVFRQANEALALIAEAEKAGELPTGAWGLSGARLADYLRGYSFMLRGEYAAVLPLLRRVVEAEPNLKEAALTLALVESKLGENPRKSFLQGVWRQRGKLVVRDTKKPASEEEALHEPDPFTEGEDVSPSMPSLFDVSQATPGRLPSIKRPNSPEDLMAMTASYTPSMLEYMSAAAHQHNDIAGPAIAAFEASGAPPAYKGRMLALFNHAMLRIGAAREIDQAARETDYLRNKLDHATETEVDEGMAAREPIHRHYAEINNIPGHSTTQAELDKYAKELNASTQVAIERTSKLLENCHHALEREFTIRSSYMYGMLGHIGAPALRTALLAEAEAVRNEMQVEQLSAVINLSPTIGAMTNPSPRKPEDGAKGKGPGCSDDDAKWSMGVDLHVIAAELSCNSVSLELEMPVIPPFAGVSAEVGIDTSGTITVFVGAKVSANNVGSAKEGLYVTAGKDGVRDFVGKAELKTSSGIGPVSVNLQVGSSSISFIPGPDAGPPPGRMPTFTNATN